MLLIHVHYRHRWFGLNWSWLWAIICEPRGREIFSKKTENILYNKETSKFTLIDWREGFGSSVEVGDVYYDLSKLYHALAINGSIVLNRGYDYKIKGDSAEISFQARSNLMYLMESLEKFTKNNGYCWNNVRILGSLHHLNICTLYESILLSFMWRYI